MTIGCEVIPRRDAPPEQLRALGAALERWYVRESQENGIAHYIDAFALGDLLSGELPQPFALRFSTKSHPRDAQGQPRPDLTMDQIREASPQAALSRSLYFKVWSGPAHDRQRTIASLRQDISAEWVEDIRIDGRSWDED